eukprot:TRINITY_DN16783_c0_g1_i1.p1 TRINITY_DN16783_c0_g1~~TRINITY_DN16783_c0_g1_i1.p1  ORF type:complete len:580 (-),score=69.57 TRINITY_DN16783_c0_g1_i1:45-1784(-)
MEVCQKHASSCPLLSKLPVAAQRRRARHGELERDQDELQALGAIESSASRERRDDSDEAFLSEDNCSVPVQTLHAALGKQPKCSMPLLTAGVHLGLKEQGLAKHLVRDHRASAKQDQDLESSLSGCASTILKSSSAQARRALSVPERSSSTSKLISRSGKIAAPKARELQFQRAAAMQKSFPGAWRPQRPNVVPLRVGNVVKAKKDARIDNLTIPCGQFGRVEEVGSDGVAMVSFDGNAVRVPRKDVKDFEIQLVTHEVEMINMMGQQVGMFLRCIICDDHGDGFLDIICQDGRKEHHVHSAFVKPLPQSQCTDLGFSPTAKPAASASASRSPRSSTSDQISLRMAELLSAQELTISASEHDSGSSSNPYELPPAGLEKQKRATGLFAAGSALRAARSSKALQVQSEATSVPEDDIGQDRDGEQGSVCPFMEIQEGGLSNLQAACQFTSRDVVYDLGCGTGKILDKVLASFPCKGVAVDVNQALVRKAEQRLHRYGQRYRVQVDDVRNVDLEGATATVSYFLSHSFLAQGASLKEHLSKRLSPGCVVYNYTYPIPGWHGSCTYGWHRYVIGQHLAEVQR